MHNTNINLIINKTWDIYDWKISPNWFLYKNTYIILTINRKKI